MMKKICQSYVNAEARNALYAEGYRYIVEGDYKVADSTDPWSGMPNTTNNIYAFTDKAEAEAFAVKQIWVFNPKVHADVEALPEHTETYAESVERYDREKAERKAKKEAKEVEKAAALNLTLDEYKAEKNRQARIKRLRREMVKLEEELAHIKNTLAKLGG